MNLPKEDDIHRQKTSLRGAAPKFIGSSIDPPRDGPTKMMKVMLKTTMTMTIQVLKRGGAEASRQSIVVF